MERARATWTDERLDDLSSRVEDGFARIDQDLRELRTRIDAHSSEMGARIDAQGTELSRRIDALQRTMVQFGGGMTLAILATLVSVIATRA
jgi:hypothetical protein